MGTKAIRSNVARSEVERFAKWFHQDFYVIFSQITDGVDAYISGLDSAQKRTLKLELLSLLKDNPGKEQKGLRNAWRRLGAQTVPRDLRAVISSSIAMLDSSTSTPNHPLQRTPASGRR